MSFFGNEGGGTATDNGGAGVVAVAVGTGVGGGDIWSSGAFAFESPLKDLLDSGSYSMDDLLAEDELLQELRGMHPQLVEYFSTEESLTRLVKHLTMTATVSQRQSHRAGDREAATNEASSVVHQSEVTSVNSDGSFTPAKETTQTQEQSSDGAFSGVEDAGENSEKSQSLATTTTAETAASFSASPSKAPQHPAGASGDFDLECIRFPYMACEVICCKIGSIVDILVDGHVSPEESIAVVTSSEVAQSSDVEGSERDEQDTADSADQGDTAKPAGPSEGTEAAMLPRTPLIDLLFSVLSETPPGQLDDRRAGYLEKVVSVLFQHRPVAMSAYINGDVVGSRNFGNGGLGLLKDLFRQIHSHSVTQIVQRLLLPPPPSAASFSPSPQSVSAPNDLSLDSDVNTTANQPAYPLASENTQDGNDSSGWALGPGEGEESPGGAIICNWCQHSDTFELLLFTLAGRDQVARSELDNQGLFDASQNAADVLITIIQNSVLTSPNIKFLTTDQALNEIIEIIRSIVRSAKSAADELEKVPSPLTFSRHESLLTTVMSVLESLVLQLGGYGAVAAAPLPPPPPPSSFVAGVDSTLIMEGGNGDESAYGTSTTVVETVADSGASIPASANSGALERQLPSLLESMSELLTHSTTESWLSPVQYDLESSAPRHLLGVSRLRMVRLLEALVLLGNPKIDAVLCRSDALEKCLDLFWKFPWCSMLHQSVANFLVHILEGADDRVGLQEYLVIRCDLPRRLMDSFEESPVASSKLQKERPQNDGLSSKWNERTKAGMEEDSSDMVMVQSSPEQGVADNDNIDTGCGDEAVVLESPAENEREGAESDVLASDGVVLPSGNGKLTEECGEEVSAGVDGGSKSAEKESGGGFVQSKQPKDSSSETKSTPPSFRLGYMGHVIIVCQAFVHACSSSGVLADGNQAAGASDVAMVTANSTVNGEMSGAMPEKSLIDASGLLPDSQPVVPTADIMAGSSRVRRPEIVNILQRLDAYPRWERFVKTTLAAEVTIQSTPLGGFPGTPGTDMGANLGTLQHAQPSNVGTTGESAVEATGQFDDNDLEIAASMMEAISLPGPSTASSQSKSATDLGGSPATGAGSGPSDYFFDDPLGRRNHFEDAGDDDDSDDEEEEQAARDSKLAENDLNSGEKDERGEDHDEVPVMNLFAGNFSFEGANSEDSGADRKGDETGEDGTKSDWANFANFENAFGSDVGSSVDDVNSEPTPPREGSSASEGDTFVRVDDSGAIKESLFEGDVPDAIPDPFEAAEKISKAKNSENSDSVDFFSSPNPTSTIDLLSEVDETFVRPPEAENSQMLPPDVETVATEGHDKMIKESDQSQLVQPSSVVDVSRKEEETEVVDSEDKDVSMEQKSTAMDPAEVSSQPVMVSP